MMKYLVQGRTFQLGCGGGLLEKGEKIRGEKTSWVVLT